jgi:hypothetical protein
MSSQERARKRVTVSKLPAGEPEACKQLWAGVAALLKKVEMK